MSQPYRRPRYRFMLLGAIVLLVVGLAFGLRGYRTTGQCEQPDSFPIPPFSESPYLNTGPDARYIGTVACAECHKGSHRSYSLTAHSRAMADVDPKGEPPDGSFLHEPSGRTYRVYRQGGQLRHAEVLRTESGKEIAGVDVPVRYVVGSGHFARTYIVEVEGFLHESPITWYTTRNKWDMSPGYDLPDHGGFERPITGSCLTCHAGQIETSGEAGNRLTIHQQSISCENCHGPGSIHQELHRAKQHTPGQPDFTIVHPARLDRARQEAICASCHLNPAATIPVRGRQLTDFRPGRPLTDYRISYNFKSGSDMMTVSGHVEQLRRSACYQKSENLTCVTCHDPHAAEKPADRVAHFRRRCLECHAHQGCKVDEAERVRTNSDNCAACHMPSSGTEIPHVAFTHHRIGRHGVRSPDGGQVPELVPSDNDSHLSPVDRKRNLGLAYLLVAWKPAHAQHADTFRQRGRELLESVRADGLRDSDTSVALAGIYRQENQALGVACAKEAAEAAEAPPEVRARAVALLVEADYQNRDFAAAAARLEELVRYRRTADDWRLLGICYLELGRPARALSALQKAEAIRPYRRATHAALAMAYKQLGQPDRAREHIEKGDWLLKRRQD